MYPSATFFAQHYVFDISPCYICRLVQSFPSPETRTLNDCFKIYSFIPLLINQVVSNYIILTNSVTMHTHVNVS